MINERVKKLVGIYLWFEAGFQLLTAIEYGTPGNVGLAGLCTFVSIIWLCPIFKNTEEIK